MTEENSEQKLIIQKANFEDSIIALTPPTSITLSNKGKSATIDFSGDSVKFSGDLSVDESAKVLFECLFGYIHRCNKCYNNPEDKQDENKSIWETGM